MQARDKAGYFNTSLIVAVFMLFFSLIYLFTYKRNGNLGFFVHLHEIFKLGTQNKGSGIIGGIIGYPMIWAFGLFGSRIINILMLFTFIMFLTSTTLSDFLGTIFKPFKSLKTAILNIKFKRNDNMDHDNSYEVKTLCDVENNRSDIKNFSENKQKNEYADIAKAAAKCVEKIKGETRFEKPPKIAIKAKEETENFFSLSKFFSNKEAYKFPPVDLLNLSEKPNAEDISSELQTNGEILVKTLKNFNVQTKILEINRGPSVTRYELQPAMGIKISKITQLADDIALSLAAPAVRIEAPIPGKSAVGIEIPNKSVSVVSMREILTSKVFTDADSKLTVILGKDISGNAMVADLAKMPHLLIAGSTGSGKSVCINSFIMSILYKASPDEVQLLMIDPKVVELGIYNNIPHLLLPVITDPKIAARVLNSAVNEMLKRYKIFAENNVRDLSSYNEMVTSSGEINKKMSKIIIIIDELADLMMAAPNQVEDYICRLAQMARAAGIHLVIATQRPSVDVITGIIKANVPSRIALAVSSQVDSRTIIDMCGAERLLGRGDMLFSPIGSSKPIRVQGCYVTDKEIDKVVEYVKNNNKN